MYSRGCSNLLGSLRYTTLPEPIILKTPNGHIRTYSGIMFPVFDPKPEHIKLMDIAHALAHECRWQGMSKRMFSVAEHSIWVARMAREISGSDDIMIYALLHDAHEAYLSDIPKPLKENFPILKEAANKIDAAIREHLALKKSTPEQAAIIHLADEYSAWVEARVLFYRDGDDTWSPGLLPDDAYNVPRDMYYDAMSPAQSPYVIRDAYLSILGHQINFIK